MTAPTLAFSAIIGFMSALSDSIWEYRISGVKTQTFGSNYVIDPSGYVTDATTNKPLEGVTATAYRIENDGSETNKTASSADLIYVIAAYDKNSHMITGNLTTTTLKISAIVKRIKAFVLMVIPL